MLLSFWFQLHSIDFQIINRVMFHSLCTLDTPVHLIAWQDSSKVLTMQGTFWNFTLTDISNLRENMPFVVNSSLKFKTIILWCRAFQILNLSADFKPKINYTLINVALIFTTYKDLFSFTWFIILSVSISTSHFYLMHLLFSDCFIYFFSPKILGVRS